MNPLKRICCRTFQTGLKIALPLLPYRKPKVVGSAKTLPEAALPETEGRRQRKDPAGSHSEKEMQQSPDHHGCREQETGTDPPPGKVSGGRRHSIFHLFYPVPVLLGAPELERFYYMLMPEPGEENGNEDPRERSRRR